PTFPGLVSADLAAGAAEDVAGNPGAAAHFARTFSGVPVALVPDPCKGGATALAVSGSVGNDAILFRRGLSGKVEVLINGISRGSFAAPSRLIAYGQGGDDTLTVSGVTIPALLYGDAGADTLQAGAGAAILVGGDGADSLRGGSGRDLL